MADLKKAINELVEPPGKAKSLPATGPASQIGPRIGVGRPRGAGAGGGIGSPLVEVAYAQRTYHVGKYVTSSDGLFQFQALKSIKFADPGGVELELQFKAPP